MVEEISKDISKADNVGNELGPDDRSKADESMNEIVDVTGRKNRYVATYSRRGTGKDATAAKVTQIPCAKVAK